MRKLLEKFRRWVAGDMGEQNKQLTELLAAARSVITGLNSALGKSYTDAQTENFEKLILLGAIALQSGGEIVLPNAFISAVSTGEYSVEISPSQDKDSLVIRLKWHREDGLPFPPAEAATEPPEICT